MLDDCNAIVFLLIDMVPMSAVNGPLCRVSPNFWELRGEQERELFVFDLMPVMEAEHRFAPLNDVERKLAVVDC